MLKNFCLEKKFIALLECRDDQNFEAEAQFVFNELTEYEFSLKNEITDFKKIQQFLADSLAAKVKPYQLQDPIATNLKLKGKAYE